MTVEGTDGSRSPAGDPHPGTIRFEGPGDEPTHDEPARGVPQSIAWCQVDGAWVATTRIVATGPPGHLEISRFGSDGQLLDTTVQAPPPPPRPGPQVREDSTDI